MDQLPSVAANVHVPIFCFCSGKTPTIRSFSHKQATGQEMRVRLCFSPLAAVGGRLREFPAGGRLSGFVQKP